VNGRGHHALQLSVVATTHAPDDLRAALAGLLDGLPPRRAAAAVERLIASYRGNTPTHAPVLRDRADVAAYAAYRMPATYAAVRAALGQFRARAGDWAPSVHVDVGGGTGAAAWAVADAWPHSAAGGAGPASTVLDWSDAALALGRELAAAGALPGADWRHAVLGGPLPEADLVTVTYVLGELRESVRTAVVAEAATSSRGAVVVVEPGTPDGFARVLAAREQLLGAGFAVLAPCPHSGACPVNGTDWCHFAVRVPRTSLHRQVKGGLLPYEDEKFSYVAAARFRAGGEGAAHRVVRHPLTRKGQVLLDLCTADGALHRATVSKRSGERYRAARRTAWGDPWHP
jgi:ribosomal protein RSM22 (predicted rRNA methylase)